MLAIGCQPTGANPTREHLLRIGLVSYGCDTGKVSPMGPACHSVTLAPMGG
ncbi:MAG: hypothetical protein JRI77_07155 [Deltaproteobacteria bacterium]|nr:hypothetical protein [Deltaproteobacteria bacterium]